MEYGLRKNHEIRQKGVGKNADHTIISHAAQKNKSAMQMIDIRKQKNSPGTIMHQPLILIPLPQKPGMKYAELKLKILI